MTFPRNPNDDDLHEAFGRKLRYRSGKWQVVSSPTVATVTEEAPKTEAVAQAVDLPMTGNEVGAMTYVQESNRLYVWNGSGWFEVALVNTNPTITNSGAATYELASDGTPTVITLTANDPEGIPLTWGYQVTGGSLEDTLVSNSQNVFTITPGTVDAVFNLRFTASDGVNTTLSPVKDFTLSFGPKWSFSRNLLNPNEYGTVAGDGFGSSVAVSENYIFVGAPYEEGTGGQADAGRVYIFNATSGVKVATINDYNNYNTPNSDYFGSNIAVSGNYLLISAAGEDAPNYTTTGVIYGYKTVNGSWTDVSLEYTISYPNPNSTTYATNQRFGGHGQGQGDIAISGNYFIVGNPNELGTGGQTANGAAHIYNLTTGALISTIRNPSTTTAVDYFGCDVSISGNYCVVGANQVENGSGTTNVDSGKIYVYKTNNGSWTDIVLEFTINNPNVYGTYQNDKFGHSVAITSSYIIASAPEEDSSGGGSSSGRVYVFSKSTGSLIRTINNPNPYGNSDQFGFTIESTEEQLIVSAPWKSGSIGGGGCGIVYAFNPNTGELIGTMDAFNSFQYANKNSGKIFRMYYDSLGNSTRVAVGLGDMNIVKVYQFA